MGNSRIKAGVILGAIVLTVVVVLAVRTVLSFGETSNWVLHTQQVRVLLAELIGEINAIESDARGYYLSGSESFLARLEEGRPRADAHQAELQALTRDNARQQERLQQLASLIRQRMDVLTRIVEIRRNQGLDTAVEAVATGQGQQLMAQIRGLVAEMEAEEERLLVQRLAEARLDARRTLWVLAGGILLDVMLFFVVLFMLRREWRLREESTNALQASAEEIRDLYNRAPCGYHSLDGTGTFVAINDTELAWLGYERDEVLGRLRFSDVISPDSLRVFQSHFPIFKKQGVVKELEFEMVRKNGTIFPALLNSQAIFNERGEYLSSRSTVFDITELKRAELVVDNARRYAESIVDTVREPLVILTSDLRVNSANRSFYRVFRTTPEETVGRPFSDLAGGQWAIPELIEQLGRVVPESFTIEEFEVSREFPLIGPKVMLLNARKLYRPGNHTTLALIAIEDITERKRAHEELEAFSYSVSHDLRAPLRHISGFASMLQNHLGTSLDEKGLRYVKTISESARKLGQLIDDLLAFSRISRTEMVRRTVPLDEVVREVRQLLSAEVGSRHIEWVIEPLPVVEGDASLLGQVFQNLLSNAVKYTRNRETARIEILPAPAAAHAREVVVCVRDNGAGFDMRYSEKLFGVFQRLHSAAEFEGTGVGLANVRRIVQRHGGRIWAEAEVDRGATFYLALPAAVEVMEKTPEVVS